MTAAEAKQIALDALAKGRLRIAPRGLLPATAARLLLSVLHGKPKIYARRQLLYEARREKGRVCRGTPLRITRRPELAGLSPREYAREYARIIRGSTRRNKIRNP
jgi:hypothetical protein